MGTVSTFTTWNYHCGHLKMALLSFTIWQTEDRQVKKSGTSAKARTYKAKTSPV